MNLRAVAKMVPAGTVPAVLPWLLTTYLTTPADRTWNSVESWIVPVAEPSELIVPITMSPKAALAKANVPLVVEAALYWETVADVNAAVP